MGHYNTVKAGDPFRPSAKLENEVRRFFNGGVTISGQMGKNSVANNNRIYVKNSSEEKTIPAYSAVTITEKEGVFYADLAVDANGFWGIAIETLAPASSGSVVVAGVVSAFVSASGSGDFVAPRADGKLTRTSSGRGQLLYAGDEKTPGVILLGAGGGGSECEYNGYFKISVSIIADGTAQVTITNGSVGGSSICRVNDREFSVPSFTENIVIQEGDISVQASYALQYVRGQDKVEIINIEKVDPNVLFTTPFVRIGRIVGSYSNGVSAIQDSYGIPLLLWFDSCVVCDTENTDTGE